MKITPISALSDNYIWAIQINHQAIIIDPSEAGPVQEYLTQQELALSAILLTHNHHDHTDGVPVLHKQFPQVPVYGPEETQVFNTENLKPEQAFELLGQGFRVIESGGHTAGHISYLMNKEQLFCGDALFSGGCGRVFTGDYAAQFATLERFKQLPDFVEVYPAHEYTQSNLKFAVAELASNCILLDYQERVDILRRDSKPSLPTTIGLEKEINPFMQAVDFGEFIAMRQRKDNF